MYFCFLMRKNTHIHLPRKKHSSIKALMNLLYHKNCCIQRKIIKLDSLNLSLIISEQKVAWWKRKTWGYGIDLYEREQAPCWTLSLYRYDFLRNIKKVNKVAIFWECHKIWKKNHHFDLTLLSRFIKKKLKIFLNFVASSQYLIFWLKNSPIFIMQKLER